MEITYTEEKKFTQEQAQQLFLSVGWISGKYPTRLYKALMNSSTVITAWDGPHLAGLVRVLDDSEMVAYMHYVLVDPKYQGQGIAGRMIQMAKEKYKNFLYIEVMPEDMDRLLALREEITSAFRSLGYIYVSMDLRGFRSGSIELFVSWPRRPVPAR